MNKGRGQVEGSIHDPRRGIWTYSDVLWAYKFPSNILNNDKWDSLELNQHWESSDLYWWCYSKNGNREGTWWDNRGSSEEVSRE